MLKKNNLTNFYFNEFDYYLEYSLYINNHKPDDLCFFKKSDSDDKIKIFLGTVSHERMCNIYIESEDMLNGFKKLGNWKEVEFWTPAFITLYM